MMANWFDFRDPKYLAAYVQYKSTGKWPTWVQEALDENTVILHEHWEIMLCECMADAWVAEKLKEYTENLPSDSVENVLRKARDT
jgi:hypothetical protein